MTSSEWAGDPEALARRHAGRMPEATQRRELLWQAPGASLGRLAGMAGIDSLRLLLDEQVPPQPMSVLMRIALREIDEGRVTVEAEPAAEHLSLLGTVHGGFVATLLDTVMASAVHSTLAADRTFATLTLEVKMLRPLTDTTGRVTATGTVLHGGRAQATAQGAIRSMQTGKLLAIGTTTCIVIPSPTAGHGRGTSEAARG